MDRTKTSVGRWTKLFGKDASYSDEILHAGLARSTTREEFGQLQIFVEDPLPGWEVPLWGADYEFLYLRRPEGVWKINLPAARAGQAVMLCVRDSNKPSAFLETHIGSDLAGRGGWLFREGEPWSPTAIDAMNDASQLRPDVFADERGWMLTREHSRDGPRVVYDAGAAFGSPPSSLRGQGEWVVGRDTSTGRSVAFALTGGSLIAFQHEELWLRFSGDLLLPFEARVTGQPSSTDAP